MLNINTFTMDVLQKKTLITEQAFESFSQYHIFDD